MRQSRDGVTEIIDVAPRVEQTGILALLKRRIGQVALIWCMRTLAWVWVAKGLFNWSIVLGLIPRFPDFAMLPRPCRATIVFFAAADLLAAVGLWLAAPGAACFGCSAR